MSDEPTSPEQTTVLITGASRGLGAGIAARFGALGFRLGLCARNQPDPPLGAAALVCEAVDVRDADALDAFAQRCTEQLGPIGLWINNAGVLDPIGPLRTAPVEDLATHVQVNLLGVIWGSRAFTRIVHARDEAGTLVNITSGAARSVYAGWAAYCATKAGVDQLTRVIDAEERDFGLRVFAVSPGVVDTDMQALIRSTPAEKFAHVDRFIDIFETDAFNSPVWVADHILELHRSARTGTFPTWAGASADAVVVRIPGEPRG